MAYLSCGFFTWWLELSLDLHPLRLVLNHSVLQGPSGAAGAWLFHYNSYKTPANISKHVFILTSTTWLRAKVLLVKPNSPTAAGISALLQLHWQLHWLILVSLQLIQTTTTTLLYDNEQLFSQKPPHCNNGSYERLKNLLLEADQSQSASVMLGRMFPLVG